LYRFSNSSSDTFSFFRLSDRFSNEALHSFQVSSVARLNPPKDRLPINDACIPYISAGVALEKGAEFVSSCGASASSISIASLRRVEAAVLVESFGADLSGDGVLLRLSDDEGDSFVRFINLIFMVDPDNRFFFDDGTDFGVSPLLLLLLFLLPIGSCFGVSGAVCGSGRDVPGFHILVCVLIVLVC
jgi:hypothetical protein